MPATVLVSPIRVDDTAAWFEEVTAGDYDRSVVARSHELAAQIERVALERGVLYADTGQVATAGADGLHLTVDSHARLAELVASAVLRGT
jgi:hypothetical protein